jgi:protein disulfide isomerase
MMKGSILFMILLAFSFMISGGHSVDDFGAAGLGEYPEDMGGDYGYGYGDGDYGMDGMDGMGGMDGMDGMGGQESKPEVLETSEDVLKFIDESSELAGILAYIDADTNADDLEAFESTATMHSRTYRWAVVTDKSLLEETKYDGCAVLVYKSSKYYSDKYGEKRRARYPGKKINSDSLANFVFEKAIPMVGEYTWETTVSYDNNKLPTFLVFGEFDHDKNPKGWTYLYNRVKRVAQNYYKEFAFAIAKKSTFDYLLNDFDLGGMKDDKNVAGMGIKKGNMAYTMEGDNIASIKFSAENMETFIQQFKSGKLTGKQSSSSMGAQGGGGYEDEEDDELDDSVTVLDSGNFQKEVVDTEADALLEFYAPWCGHCKALKPEFNKVGRHFKDDAGVTIGAFDATASDPPQGFDIQGYPTIMYVKASDKKNPVPYEGARDSDAMIEWIKENRST